MEVSVFLKLRASTKLKGGAPLAPPYINICRIPIMGY
jgi:hypothetical protein